MEIKTTAVSSRYESETLSIEHDGRKDSYFHLNRVQVFTGDDAHAETDCIEVVSSNDKLIAKRILNHEKSSQFRIRGEVGVRLFVSTENFDCDFLLTLCHHKGSIQVVAFEIEKEAEELSLAQGIQK